MRDGPRPPECVLFLPQKQNHIVLCCVSCRWGGSCLGVYVAHPFYMCCVVFSRTCFSHPFLKITRSPKLLRRCSVFNGYFSTQCFFNGTVSFNCVNRFVLFSLFFCGSVLFAQSINDCVSWCILFFLFFVFYGAVSFFLIF